MKHGKQNNQKPMKKFIKKIENFVCEKCGREVIGTGFTNHCPHCLWSKHVDVNPGDRAAECGGMMRPIRVEGSSSAARDGKEYSIIHVCEKCGHEKKNRVAPDDDFNVLAKISAAYQSLKF
jgi:rubrerythrin